MTNDARKITVWWIDDDHGVPASNRDAMARALTAQADGNLLMECIHPVNFEESVEGLADGESPELVLIDFRLSNHPLAGRETSLFTRDGVSLRSSMDGIPQFRDVPKYLVSGVIRDEQKGSADERFDWVLSQDDLTQLGGEFLYLDSCDYERIRELVAESDESGAKISERIERLSTSMLNVVAPPDASKDQTLEVLTHVVSTTIRGELRLIDHTQRPTRSKSLTIGHWLRSAFQELRGPLIDELASATLVGATMDYFVTSMYQDIVESTPELSYQGIFSRTGRMDIWKEVLREWVLSQSDTLTLSSPGKFARDAADVLQVPDEHRAKCRVCGDLWPEGIAYDEDDPSVEAAVHWRCSYEVKDIDPPFGFDIPRTFSD